MASSSVGRHPSPAPKSRPTKKDTIYQNIQVAVRCRPINQYEIKEHNSISIVDCSPPRSEVIVKQRLQTTQSSKTFRFDHVFGPEATQNDVYRIMVLPLVNEVLAGYNCTIFAYGLTGTGKTYTMTGERDERIEQFTNDPNVGIVPRSLAHLFDKLNMLNMDEFEYNVYVSYVELYNEELVDLLVSGSDQQPLRIFDDPHRKGSTIVHGLLEVPVKSKRDVLDIMAKGAQRRQVAATLINAQSSRSHTVFTVTVHIKESTPDGEELVKTGKLYLVDLAGSENVMRSGSGLDRDRANEAGKINRSLLTLGRCITSLVEHSKHVPYRESKLTRILQDSLGGKTKTSIIATITPSHHCIEETLNTLDYAHRAKDVTNRPEVNQKVAARTLIKNYTDEIARLQRDLAAQRSGGNSGGFWISVDTYNEMDEEVKTKTLRIEDLQSHLTFAENELLKLRNLLESSETHLQQTKQHLKSVRRQRNEQSQLVESKRHYINRLMGDAHQLREVNLDAQNELDLLHDRLERDSQAFAANETALSAFRDQVNIHVADALLENDDFVSNCVRVLERLENQQAVHVEQSMDALAQLGTRCTRNQQVTEAAFERFTESMTDMEVVVCSGSEDMRSVFAELHKSFRLVVDRCSALINENLDAARTISGELSSVKQNSDTWHAQLKSSLTELEKRLKSLQLTNSSWLADQQDAFEKQRRFFTEQQRYSLDQENILGEKIRFLTVQQAEEQRRFEEQQRYAGEQHDKVQRLFDSQQSTSEEQRKFLAKQKLEHQQCFEQQQQLLVKQRAERDAYFEEKLELLAEQQRALAEHKRSLATMADMSKTMEADLVSQRKDGQTAGLAIDHCRRLIDDTDKFSCDGLVRCNDLLQSVVSKETSVLDVFEQSAKLAETHSAKCGQVKRILDSAVKETRDTVIAELKANQEMTADSSQELCGGLDELTTNVQSHDEVMGSGVAELKCRIEEQQEKSNNMALHWKTMAFDNLDEALTLKPAATGQTPRRRRLPVPELVKPESTPVVLSRVRQSAELLDQTLSELPENVEPVEVESTSASFARDKENLCPTGDGCVV